MKFSASMTLREFARTIGPMLILLLDATPSQASRIVVLSDIHIKVNAEAPLGLERAIEETLRVKPDLVVLAGDMTSGNPGDGMSPGTVQSWWNGLKRSLHPLEQANIPILPIPGNHDWYTEAHRQAYRNAWPAPPAGVSIQGLYPIQYIAHTPDAELFFLPIVDQVASRETVAFLRTHPKPSGSNHARIAFGHVPLASRMGRTNPSFQAGFGTELLNAGFSFYISGHEHLVWDESLPTATNPSALLRQLWVGTASGSYTFPIRQSLFNQHCLIPVPGVTTTLCTMPETQRTFRVRASDRSQVLEQNFAIVLTGKDRKRPASNPGLPEVELRGWDPDLKRWRDFYEP